MTLTPLVLALWMVQAILLLLAFIGCRRGSGIAAARPIGLSSCMLAICAGWIARLTYQYVLSSNGFRFFVLDDPCRWLMAYGWLQSPYLITWDGLWLGGTFYLHGLAMSVIDDPLMASHFLAVIFNMLPLAGLFVLTQGIFRNRLLSCAAVVLAGPWWLHILLGPGAMSELPMTTFILLGGGLLLLGLQEQGARRGRYLAGAVASFLMASTFHYVAWFNLGAILLVLLAYALRRNQPDLSFGLKQWLLIAGGSTLYCVIWIIGCWIKFGEPLHFLKLQHHLLTTQTEPRSLGTLLLAYPKAFLFSIWEYLPLVLAGFVWAGWGRSVEAGRARAAWGAILVGLATMIALSSGGGANAVPYRSIIALSTATIPLALAPLRFGFAGSAGWDRRFIRLLSWGLVLFAALLWTKANHRNMITRQRLADIQQPDAIALGSWLRQELQTPFCLARANLMRPIRFWVADASKLHDVLTVEYINGDPRRLERWLGVPDPNVETLEPGQVLAAMQPVNDTRLEHLAAIGCYQIYMRHGQSKADVGIR